MHLMGETDETNARYNCRKSRQQVMLKTKKCREFVLRILLSTFNYANERLVCNVLQNHLMKYFV